MKKKFIDFQAISDKILTRKKPNKQIFRRNYK